MISTAQHSTAQHSTAQHSTAQHSTAKALLLTALLGFGSICLAQEITGLSLKQPEVGIGEDAAITITFQPKPNYQNCGVQIDFGDGIKEHYRIEANQPLLTVLHKYQQAGAKFIQIEGKTRFQGLATTFNCAGEDKKIALNVNSEDLSAQRAATLAAKTRALQSAKADEAAANLTAKQAKAKLDAAQASARQTATAKAKADKQALAQAAADKVASTKAAANASIKPSAAPPPAAPATRAPSDSDKKPATKAKSVVDL